MLVREQALAASVSGFLATGSVPYNLRIGVIGAARMHNGDWSYLEAGGRWQGFTTHDGVQFGRLESTAIMPGMSGAPVSIFEDGTIGEQYLGEGMNDARRSTRQRSNLAVGRGRAPARPKPTLAVAWAQASMT